MIAIAGAFAAIVAVTICFAIWDRRSMIKPLEYRMKDSDRQIEENSHKIQKIILSFKELGSRDERIATVLRSISQL